MGIFNTAENGKVFENIFENTKPKREETALLKQVKASVKKLAAKQKSNSKFKSLNGYKVIQESARRR